ncbi:MAG: hypothetical protein AAF446_01910 [Pseudomonadota bacterium]
MIGCFANTAKSKSVAPPASLADAPYFFGKKSKQKRYRRVRRPASRDSLWCSSQAGRKELAALRQLFACFRLTLRSSAAARLIKINSNFKSKTSAPLVRSLLADESPLLPDCQQCLAFKPLISDEANAGAEKQKRSRQANSTSIFLKPLKPSGFKRPFCLLFVARHKKSVASAGEAVRRNAFDFQNGNQTAQRSIASTSKSSSRCCWVEL